MIQQHVSSSTVLLLTKTKGPENDSVLSVCGVDQYMLKEFFCGQENLCYTVLSCHEYFGESVWVKKSWDKKLYATHYCCIISASVRCLPPHLHLCTVLKAL